MAWHTNFHINVLHKSSFHLKGDRVCMIMHGNTICFIFVIDVSSFIKSIPVALNIILMYLTEEKFVYCYNILAES